MASALGNKGLDAAINPSKSWSTKTFLHVADKVKGSKDAVINQVQRFLKGTGEVIKKGAIPAVVIPESKEKTKKHEQVALHTLEQFNKNASNPEIVHARIMERTKNLGVVAPKITAALVQKSVAAMSYLGSVAPRDPLAMYGMHKSKWTPSDKDLASWRRSYEAVEKPHSVIEDFATGKATKEGFDALKAVYPQLYREFTDELLTKISEHADDIPYSKKAQISIMFGMPSDFSLRPEFITAMQKNHAKATLQEEQKNLNIKVAKNGMSDVERTLTRGST